MSINKVVYGETVLIDLTGDTVTPDTLLSGVKAHDQKGDVITGTLFSGYPDTVSILKVSSPTTLSKKEKNLIIYKNQILIDLTGDTVTPDTLLSGYRCHKKDGSLIYGTFLKDYPSSIMFTNNIKDSNGNDIADANDNTIQSTVVYKKTTSGNYIIYIKA